MGVKSPLHDNALTGVDARVRMVQFSSMLGDEDFQRLAGFLEGRPDIALRVFGNYDGSIANLDFLHFFPKLQRFIADVYQLDNVDGLHHLPTDLHELGLGQTRKRLSLAPLRRFTSLQRLWLEGHTKGIEVLSELTSLADLSLRSITLLPSPTR